MMQVFAALLVDCSREVTHDEFFTLTEVPNELEGKFSLSERSA